MPAAAGHGDQRQIAVQPHHLGHGRHRRDTVERGEFPAGCGAAPGQARILRMADNQRIQSARIGHCARQHPRIGDHAHPVGKGDRAQIGQEPDLDHLAARAVLGQRGHVMDVDRRIGRAAGDEFQRFRRIDRRHRVGPGDDCGHTARGGGQTGAAETLLVTLARFADLDTPIDQPRRQRALLAVDHRRAFRRGLISGPDAVDAPVADQQAADPVGLCLWIDQPGVGEEGRTHTITPAAARPRSARRFRARRSSAAMRTATPIST